MKSKIFLPAIACLLFLSLSTVSAQAEDSISQSINTLFDTQREEKTAVIDEIGALLKLNLFEDNGSGENNIAKLFNASYYDYDAAYKAYKLPHLFISAYKESGSFGSIAGDDYQWRIPFENSAGTSGYAILGEKEGKLAYLGKAIGATCKNEYISEEIIRNAVKETDLIEKPLVKLTFLQSFMYNTTFVLLSDGDNEFVIPFAVRPEWSPVENGKIYTAKDLIAKYYDMYDEEELSKHGDEDGGVPLRNHNSETISSENEDKDDDIFVESSVVSAFDTKHHINNEVSSDLASTKESSFPIIPTVAIGGGVALILGMIVLIKKRH